MNKKLKTGVWGVCGRPRFRSGLIILLCLIAALAASFIYKTKADRYSVLIGEDSGIVKKIKNIDTLVIDADYFSESDISRLRSQGIREIYTYINIGSIEKSREYYQDYEKYTLDCYENWPDEKWIDVAEKNWQKFIASRVDEFIKKGVDGFFVDNADVYYMYPRDDVYNGIENILSYIQNKDKKIIINGGDCFVKRYFSENDNSIFDGVNQENVYTSYDFDNKRYVRNDKETRDYYTQYLDLVTQHGCTAYVTEYAVDKRIQREAAEYSRKHKYICYVSNNIDLLVTKSY